MEARLAKVWIVGLQYDGCKIKTGDQRYDYTVISEGVSGVPAHALFTLRNGGGKGVFLQSIFQPLDPLTSWKDDKNKVIHFFHNSLGKPVQYTLHIVEEWQVSDSKKMMIGISICPKSNRYEHAIENDLLIELDYILFSKIYPIFFSFDIFKLPLWDEHSQESLPLTEWKSILSRSSEIELYTIHRKNDYLLLLEENGLDLHTISLIKNLNIGEGNISGFFKGATDNIGIFHNKIIPTINDKIEDIDHNSNDNISNITTSFLETLKVSKELPILLSTIRSIEELDEFTAPLVGMYEDAYALQKSVQHLNDKGQEIYALLIKIHQKKLNQKSMKTAEFNKLSKDIEKLEWRKDNLRYVEALGKIDSLDKQYHELTIQLNSQNEQLYFAKTDLSLSQINILLKKVHSCLHKIKEAQFSLDILEKNYDINELKKELDEIKRYFQNNWESIKESWEKKVTLNYRSEVSHTNKVNELNESINIENTLNRSINESINRLNDKIKNHLDKQEIVVKCFGEKARSFLNDVICTYESHCKETSDTITSNNEKIKLQHVNIENFQNELGILKNKMDSSQAQILVLSDRIQKRAYEEKEIKEKVNSILRENLEELYVRSDYVTMKDKIASLQEELEEKLKKHRRTLLELEIEMNLIDEGKPSNIYIPNNDLVRLKKLLDENQIPNMYGTHFLKQCSREERVFMLKKNPALPFSIVVLNEEFENVDLSFLRELLFSSMIILVDGLNASKLNGYNTINPSLQKICEIDYLPMDKTFDLITDEYEFNKMITSTGKKFDDVLFEIDEKEKLMAKLNNILNKIEVILSRKLSRELQKELADINQLIQDFIIKEQTLKFNIEEARQDIATLDENTRKLSIELRKKEEQVKYLHQWNEECDEYIGYNHELGDFNLRLEKSNSKLTQLKYEAEKLNEQLQINKQTFSDWFKYANQDFTDLFTLLENISFPKPIITYNYSQDDYIKLISFGSPLDRAHYQKLTIYKDLLSQRSNRNSRIGSYLSSLESLNGELAEYQENLRTLDYFDWRDSEEPADDLTVLDKISNDLNIKVKNLENSILIVQTNINQNDKQRIEVGLNVMKIESELKKDYPAYGAVKFEIDDVDTERENIRILKKDTANHQKILRKEMDYLDGETKKIDSLFDSLNAMHINESAKDNILTEEERIILQEHPAEFYDDWFIYYADALRKHDSKKSELVAQINRIQNYINSNNDLPLKFKNGLINFLITIRDLDYERAIESISNYNNWVHHNLEDENEQKKKADDAVNFWVERAARRVLEICNCIDDLEKKMRIKNWSGVMFPLIRIEKSNPFPQKMDDFRFQIKHFCIDMIKKIIEKISDVDSLTVKQLSKHINMSNIILHVLGDYPKLKIHIPTIEGPLLRREPDNSYYKEWEVINNGSSTASTKSGGQTLMAQFIVLSMLMRQRSDENSWLFLVSDNPFGTMSAPELVEAVFCLLELLKIQWLVVAPPITNVHITSKFNTVYQMDISPDEGRLVKVLEKKNRKFLQQISILNPEH